MSVSWHLDADFGLGGLPLKKTRLTLMCIPPSQRISEARSADASVRLCSPNKQWLTGLSHWPRGTEGSAPREAGCSRARGGSGEVVKTALEPKAGSAGGHPGASASGNAVRPDTTRFLFCEP